MLDRIRGIERNVVNVGCDPPQGLDLDGDDEASDPSHEAILEIGADAVPPSTTARSLAEGGALHMRSPSESPFTAHGSSAGASSPGIKTVRRLYFHADLLSAAKRSWALREELAAKIHVGAARYRRYWVERPLSPESPPIRGIVSLHVASEEDLRERYFESPHGREEILQDIGHFIDHEFPRMFAREHVLHGPSPSIRGESERGVKAGPQLTDPPDPVRVLDHGESVNAGAHEGGNPVLGLGENQI
jgi:hypothetical protein